jgi:hypothetical protein
MADAIPLSASSAPVAIEAARELEAEGRLVDAIQLLTEANRREPDAKVEGLLVRLRHEAFTPPPQPTVTGHDQIASPPRAAPSSGTLRALAPSELSAEALRRGMARDGCVMVSGLVSQARVDRLVDGIDRALDAFDAAVAGAGPAQTSPWYAPFKPRPGQYRVGGRRNWVRASGGVWAADSPRMLFELLEVIDDLGIGALVTEYLGERPALSANKCTLRRVPVDSSADWHQDGAFLGADVRTLNVWLALSRCGRDAPGLDIVPRRIPRVLETGTEGATFDWAVSPSVVARAAGDTGVLRPEFEPGDVLLFDHFFLHRTAAEPTMTRERHAIETWFFAPSAYPGGQIPLVY